MNTSELINIVSKDDVVMGSMERADVYAQGLNAFRVINAFIVNDQGQLWIPRRHSNKKLFPLHLDTSVGGHVMAGETYIDACIREVREEVCLVVTEQEMKIIGRMTPHEHGTSAFMYVYQINSNVAPAYNTNDFVESYWLTPDELLHKLKNGDCGKGDLPIIVKHLFKQQ